jgi:L-lactate utilization protein LutB
MYASACSNFRVNGKAAKYTACRECEEVCPQGLPISKLMNEAVNLFKGQEFKIQSFGKLRKFKIQNSRFKKKDLRKKRSVEPVRKR